MWRFTVFKDKLKILTDIVGCGDNTGMGLYTSHHMGSIWSDVSETQDTEDF